MALNVLLFLYKPLLEATTGAEVSYLRIQKLKTKKHLKPWALTT